MCSRLKVEFYYFASRRVCLQRVILTSGNLKQIYALIKKSVISKVPDLLHSIFLYIIISKGLL